eukprot:TRINITY_DN27818_c0_g1_i1.p1 TRINITY_DN27818_c0_g1~~TRINITY_DN27818_c0_g1_i1.p1  ORF type:complete len:2130 (+),score=548.45 TRINITY_DN27818_c0_g1_i1:44-6433(+)
MSCSLEHLPEAEIRSRTSSYSGMDKPSRQESVPVSQMSQETSDAKDSVPLGVAGAKPPAPLAVKVAILAAVLLLVGVGVGVSVAVTNGVTDPEAGPAPVVIAGADEGVYLLPAYPGTGDGGDVTDGGLITGQVPLKVGSIIPQSMEISHRQAVTVVFNKAVAALGADWVTDSIEVNGVMPAALTCNNKKKTVAGRWRWATTSMLRFDPTDDWPASLDCTFAVNAALASWDGTALDTEGADLTRRYTTAGPFLSITHVDSARAMDMTDGVWSATVAGETAEVPPDGELHVAVGGVSLAEADLPTLVSRLTTRPGGFKVSLVEGKKCQGYGQTCVVVKVDGELDVGGKYELVLPSGAALTEDAGALVADVTADFTGLKPFAFGFFDYEFTPTSRNYRIWLRHGLESEDMVSALQAQISFDPRIDFTAKLDGKATLVIHSDALDVATPYTVTVRAAAEVRDGFGLPLQGAEKSFTTARTDTSIGSLRVAGIHPEAALDEFKAFGSGWSSGGWCQGKRLSMREVTEDDMVAVINALSYNSHPWGAAEDKGRRIHEVVIKEGSAASVAAFDVTDLFGRSNLVLQIRHENLDTDAASSGTCPGYEQASVLARTDVGITVVYGGAQAHIWVTDLRTGAPVPDARVQLWVERSWDHHGVERLAEVRTGADGVATVADISARGESMHVAVVVLHGDRISMVRNLYLYARADVAAVRARVHTDRKVYRPGDTVSLKGYYRVVDPKSGVLSIPPHTTLQVSARWPAPVHTPVEVRAEYGSFDAVFDVPADAEYGDHLLLVEIPQKAHNQSVVTAAITVADPRLPAAVMDFTTDAKIVRPADGSVDLRVRTATYTGSPVPSSTVECTYTYTGAGGQPVTRHGEFTMVTDVEGLRTTSLRFPDDLVLEEGGQVVLTAKWMSPARDVLTAEIHLPVQGSLWLMRLPSLEHDAIPGIAFDATATVVTALDANPAAGVGAVVTIEAFLLPDSMASPWLWIPHTVASSDVEGKPVAATCTAAAVAEGDDAVATCGLVLPSMGLHALRARVTDNEQQVVEAFVVVGRTATDWAKRPLHRPPPVGIAVQNTQHTPGAAVEVSINNPYSSAHVWVVVHDLHGAETVTQPVAAGDSVVSVTMEGDRCRHNCWVRAVVVTARDAHTSYSSLVEGFPVSAIADLDKYAAFTRSYHLTTAVPDATITTGVVLPDTVLPGATVTAEVTLTDAEGAPVDGEVAVMVVDKAILAVHPHPVPDMGHGLSELDMAGGSLEYKDNREDIIDGDEATRMYQMAAGRAAGDPWVDVAKALDPHDYSAHQNLGTLLAAQWSDLTYFPSPPSTWRGRGGVEEYSVSAEMVADDNYRSAAKAPSHGGDRAPAPTVRTQFSASPVFLRAVRVTGGKASVELPLSENVGTWVVKVIAVAAGNRFGSATEEVVARRKVSLVPSVPRIARYHDRFTAGVVVTALEPMEIAVAAALTSARPAFTLDGTTSHTLQLPKDTPTEVLYHFTAVAYNVSGEVTFTVADAATHVSIDGLAVDIPVLGVQDRAYVGTSFAIAPPADGAVAAWTEGMTFPDAVHGSGAVVVAASVGHLSAVEAVAASVRKRVDLESLWLSGVDVLRMCAGLIAQKPYIAPQEFAQAVSGREARPGQSGLSQARNAFHDALPLLRDFTIPSYGLAHSLRSTFPWVDVPLNALAVEMLGDVVDPQLAQHWREAMTSALVQRVLRARVEGKELTGRLWGNLASAFWALGDTRSFTKDAYAKGVLTLGNLVDNRAKLSAPDKAVLLKVLIRDDPEAHRWRISELTQGFLDHVRVTGRTTYIASDSGGHALSNMVQADLLHAFSSIPDVVDPALTAKLAAFVAQGTGASAWWMASGGDVQRMLALGGYDARQRSTDPDVRLRVNVGADAAKAVMAEAFEGAAGLRKVATAEFTYDEITDEGASGPSPLLFSAEGDGEVNVALGLSFVPAALVTKPKYFGLYVQKAVRVLTGRGTSAVLTGNETVALYPGDIVQVTLQITSPDDVAGVTVVDAQAAGVEAIDQKLPDTLPPRANTGEEHSEWDGGVEVVGASSPPRDDFTPWWHAGFRDVTVRKDRVVCQASWLPGGTHSCTYLANVVTSGVFVIPPAKAFLESEPEVMGWSAGARLTVHAR